MLVSQASGVVNVSYLPIHHNTVVFEAFFAILLKSTDDHKLRVHFPGNIYFSFQRVFEIEGSLFYDACDSETIGLYVNYFFT